LVATFKFLRWTLIPVHRSFASAVFSETLIRTVWSTSKSLWCKSAVDTDSWIGWSDWCVKIIVNVCCYCSDNRQCAIDGGRWTFHCHGGWSRWWLDTR